MQGQSIPWLAHSEISSTRRLGGWRLHDPAGQPAEDQLASPKMRAHFYGDASYEGDIVSIGGAILLPGKAVAFSMEASGLSSRVLQDPGAPNRIEAMAALCYLIFFEKWLKSVQANCAILGSCYCFVNGNSTCRGIFGVVDSRAPAPAAKATEVINNAKCGPAERESSLKTRWSAANKPETSGVFLPFCDLTPLVAGLGPVSLRRWKCGSPGAFCILGGQCEK